MENKLHESRHSAEHVLMQAMRNLGYKFHMAMGPATDDGFYFDFELLEGQVLEDDFPKIESEMKKIAAFIHRALQNPSESELSKIKKEVTDLCRSFPFYQKRIEHVG